AFLTEGTRTGKLATVRNDGRPHVTPIWFVLDDQARIVFTTGATSLKGKALRRDPRVGMAVDDQMPPYSFVVIDGVAELSEDLDDMLVWATRIAGRYMGLDKAEVYGRRNAVEGELLVTVTPDHIVAEKDIAL
ncbi:MAG TPA: PPOX class F420-dependent oxidoreductase, partial [Acidimicrobiales bacterium]|nr:PPOX class F420-dependent oxidoreductase [Acidimicrobiales bacterium]